MKKQLIAVAVAAAIAAPAMAQNVSLSGRVGIGVQNVNDGAVGASKSTRMITESTWSTARLTISVKEDLGGGLKAGYDHETAISADDGAMTMGDRNSSLYVEGGFGKIAAGRTTNILTDADVFANAFGGNQGLIGKRWMTAAELASASATTGTAANTSIDGMGDKVTNSISFTSPTVQGLQLNVTYGAGESTTAGASNNGDLTAYGVTYTAGKLKALVAAGTIKRTGTTATYGDVKQTSYAVSYDAGFAKFGLVGTEADRDNKASGDASKVTVLTANVPMGNGINVFGAYHNASVSGAQNTGSTATVLGVSKDLSKRTKLYATFASTENESAATYNITGQTAATSSNAGYDPKTTTLGVIHNF